MIQNDVIKLESVVEYCNTVYSRLVVVKFNTAYWYQYLEFLEYIQGVTKVLSSILNTVIHYLLALSNHNHQTNPFYLSTFSFKWYIQSNNLFWKIFAIFSDILSNFRFLLLWVSRIMVHLWDLSVSGCLKPGNQPIMQLKSWM